MLQQRAVASQQLMGQPLTAQVQHHGCFWVVWIMQDQFIQTRIPKEQDSSQMLCHLLHLPSYQGSISELINTRWLYCCPLKAADMKGEMFKYAFWQWDNICWSSSWSMRTQETFCIRSTSGKTSGICTFGSISMAFYSLTLPICWGEFRRQAHALWIT